MAAHHPPSVNSRTVYNTDILQSKTGRFYLFPNFHNPTIELSQFDFQFKTYEQYEVTKQQSRTIPCNDIRINPISLWV